MLILISVCIYLNVPNPLYLGLTHVFDVGSSRLLPLPQLGSLGRGICLELCLSASWTTQTVWGSYVNYKTERSPLNLVKSKLVSRLMHRFFSNIVDVFLSGLSMSISRH